MGNEGFKLVYIMPDSYSFQDRKKKRTKSVKRLKVYHFPKCIVKILGVFKSDCLLNFGRSFPNMYTHLKTVTIVNSTKT